MNYTVHWIFYNLAIAMIAQHARGEVASNRSHVSSENGANARSKRFIYPANSGIGVSGHQSKMYHV